MENRLFAKVGTVRKKPIFLNDGILIPAMSIIDTVAKSDNVSIADDSNLQ